MRFYRLANKSFTLRSTHARNHLKLDVTRTARVVFVFEAFAAALDGASGAGGFAISGPAAGALVESLVDLLELLELLRL